MLEQIVIFTGSCRSSLSIAGCCDIAGNNPDSLFFIANHALPARSNATNIEKFRLLTDPDFLAALPGKTGGVKRLCFIAPGLFCNPDAGTFFSALRAVFPQAAVDVLCVMEPQYETVEDLYALSLLSGGNPNPADAPDTARHMNYEQFFSSVVDFFGSDALRIFSHKDNAAHTVAGRLMMLPGVPDEMPSKATAPFPYRMPRYFFDFTRASAKHFPKQTPPEDSLPWALQACHFLEQVPHANTDFILTVEQQRSLMLHCERSNTAASKLVGLETLFPASSRENREKESPAPERLNEHNALLVAQTLEPEFAQQLLNSLRANEAYLHSPDEHLCLQVLHDTYTPAAFPAPRFRTRAPAPKLSVLTLAYNQAAYIGECIESVAAQQTDFPIRHIIADDGSDDGTQDIVLQYAEKYPHIIPVFQQGRSYGPGNIAALFNMARSPYVALCDGDDYFTDPHKLQMQVDFLEANKDCALCFHQARVLFEDDPDRELIHPAAELLPKRARPFFYLTDLLNRNFMQTGTVMYRWRFTGGLPDWFRTDLCPSDWYWHLLHAEKGKIGFINRVMSVYRRHAGSLYYLSEVDKLKHRHNAGPAELELYKALVDHFGPQYEQFPKGLANGVIHAMKQYAEQSGDTGHMDFVAQHYPQFMAYYEEAMVKLKQ